MQTEAGLPAALGAGLVIIAAALWARAGVAIKLVPAAAELSPQALGLARTMIAGPLVVLAAALGRSGLRRQVLRTIDRRQLAAVAWVIFQVCLFRRSDALGGHPQGWC